VIFLWLWLPLSAFALEGEFVQACRASAQRAEEFSGGSAIYRETNFLDGACAAPSLSSRSYGKVILGSASPDSQEIDFIFSRVTLTIHDPGTLDYYRANQVCGREDWALEEEVEITGLVCDFYGSNPARVPRAGERRYGIIRVGKDVIYLGALSPERDGLSPDRRPQDLDPEGYYRMRELDARFCKRENPPPFSFGL
jgi:hypothetical protein